MTTAIFGISNDGLNLVVNLVVLMLVVLWLALIAYTYLDAKRRISDPFLVGCATLGALIPYVGTAVYAIVRPPEYLEDIHERELEIKAAELRVRQLKELSCPGCGHPIDKTYLRCPGCQRRLKDPCESCGKPVDPRWSLCPYCEVPLEGGGPPPSGAAAEPQRRQRSARDRKGERKGDRAGDGKGGERRSGERGARRSSQRPGPDAEPKGKAEGRESGEQRQGKRTKGSANRESDPDPRQA